MIYYALAEVDGRSRLKEKANRSAESALHTHRSSRAVVVTHFDPAFLRDEIPAYLHIPSFTHRNPWPAKTNFPTTASSRTVSCRCCSLFSGYSSSSLVHPVRGCVRLYCPIVADSSTCLPPPPPHKDGVYATSPNSLNPPSAVYNKSFFSRSFSSLSNCDAQHADVGPGTPITPASSAPDSARSQRNTWPWYDILPRSLGKRNKPRKDVSESSNTSECDKSGKDDGDDRISKPWNFQVSALLVILGLTPERDSIASTSMKGECIHCSR